MDETRLIQGLRKAPGDPILVSSPWETGLGLTWSMAVNMKDLFSFQYMGSHEFENGSVPAAWDFIIDQRAHDGLVAGEHNQVFYIAPISYVEGVIMLIDRLLENEKTLGLREHCGLSEVLADREDPSNTVIGWLEIDNGFFFFADQAMFENCKHYFGLK